MSWGAGTLVLGGRYRVLHCLGEGGMGVVYAIEHTSLPRRFALKVLRRRFARRNDFTERLQAEAQCLAHLASHPNVVRVVDTGVLEDGRVYLLMELLEGRTLRDELASHQPFPPSEACSLMRQLVLALGAAHRIGVIHRDVKPSNMFLTSAGGVKLLDFSVAKVLNEGLLGGARRPLTEPGASVGTPRYMAPEYLVEGQANDGRVDIYSAGVVFYEMLTGRSPFPTHDDDEQERPQLIHAIVTQGVPPLETVGFGHLSPDLRTVVRRATAADPKHRYPSAEAFLADLDKAATRSSRPSDRTQVMATPPGRAAFPSSPTPPGDNETTVLAPAPVPAVVFTPPPPSPKGPPLAPPPSPQGAPLAPPPYTAPKGSPSAGPAAFGPNGAPIPPPVFTPNGAPIPPPVFTPSGAPIPPPAFAPNAAPMAPPPAFAPNGAPIPPPAFAPNGAPIPSPVFAPNGAPVGAAAFAPPPMNAPAMPGYPPPLPNGGASLLPSSTTPRPNKQLGISYHVVLGVIIFSVGFLGAAGFVWKWTRRAPTPQDISAAPKSEVESGMPEPIAEVPPSADGQAQVGAAAAPSDAPPTPPPAEVASAAPPAEAASAAPPPAEVASAAPPAAPPPAEAAPPAPAEVASAAPPPPPAEATPPPPAEEPARPQAPPPATATQVAANVGHGQGSAADSPPSAGDAGKGKAVRGAKPTDGVNPSPFAPPKRKFKPGF